MYHLGIAPGMTVFVHCSMRSFGPVEGGAQTVVKAITDVIGPRGTLVVPIYHDYFLNGQGQVWDRDQSPSKMGIFSELIRKWPGSLRSAHPSHPIAAIGPLSHELVAFDQGSAFGKDSHLMELVERNAAILLMGVGYEMCTLLHLAEELNKVPYRDWVSLTGKVVIDGVAKKVRIPFYRRRLGYSNDFSTCGRDFESIGNVSSMHIGKSKVQLFWARELLEFAMYRLKRDPMYLGKEIQSIEIKC